MKKSLMKKKNGNHGICRNRSMALLLSFSMMFAMTGCGEDGNMQADPGSNSDQAVEGNTTGGAGDNASADTSAKAMGRYVEEEIDLSEMLLQPDGIFEREDGSLIIADANKGLLVSKDRGLTWDKEIPDWFTKMLEEGYYVSEIDMTPDGTFAILYDPIPDDDYTPVMMLILPDGTQEAVEIPLEDEDDYIRQMAVSNEGRIIVRTRSRKVFEVQKDGRSELLFTLPDYTSTFYMEGNLIFIDNVGVSGMPMIYDTESGTYMEDDVLVDFVSENYNDREYDGSSYCDMYLLPDGEEIVYLLGNKGVHRHVLGGNMMEQIVDGNLSMLSNPSYSIVSAVMLEEDSFLVLFAGNKLIRYTYDPDIPAVPEKMLTIYSLHEDDNIRQVVSCYQSRNTDVFVSYEVGMEEGSAVTREDAIKKLNTQIMAGTGPDLLIMDDMPLASYVDKGMLLDITDHLEECSSQDPLFDNIIDALKIEEKAYVVPATFSIPMLYGEEEYVANVTDLSDVGESIEELRTNHPGDDIIGICNEKDVLMRFAPVSAPAWLTAESGPDREIIGEFLEQCKRIYDAQVDGIRPEIVEDYGEQHTNRSAADISDWHVDWGIANNIFGYIGGKSYLLSGWLETPSGYQEITSIERVKGYENGKRIAMAGHCTQVFMPQTLLGINAASDRIDEAKDFMSFFLSKETASDYYGFPINKAAYDAQFIPNEDFIGEDGAYGILAIVTEDGTYVDFNIYWPSDGLVAELKEELSSVNTAYIPDSVLEDAVFTEGASYMKGEQTLEEALTEIEKSVAIYMSE